MNIGRNGDLKNLYPIGRGRKLKPAPESRANCLLIYKHHVMVILAEENLVGKILKI